MIKVEITGGADRVTGELLRILLNHPDVEITGVVSEEDEGRALADAFPDLYGDTELRFLSAPERRADALIAATRMPAQLPDDLRVIDLTRPRRTMWTLGLPELTRKAMVRGARRVTVATPATTAAAISLLPLARAGVLTETWSVSSVTAEELAAVSDALHSLQPDAPAGSIAEGGATAFGRTLTVTATTRTAMPAGAVHALYADFYVDHHFAMVLPYGKGIETSFVANTLKAYIAMQRDDEGRLTLTVTLDPLLKGSAGTAVHCLNLLFGLHERTALALKHCPLP